LVQATSLGAHVAAAQRRHHCPSPSPCAHRYCPSPCRRLCSKRGATATTIFPPSHFRSPSWTWRYPHSPRLALLKWDGRLAAPVFRVVRLPTAVTVYLDVHVLICFFELTSPITLAGHIEQGCQGPSEAVIYGTTSAPTDVTGAGDVPQLSQQLPLASRVVLN